MSVKWKSSRYPGVRFYEHATRKHGVRWDRYFAIRYQAGGKRREEGLGWASDGWTESKAAAELAALKEAARKGEGPTSLAEKRAKAKAKKKAKARLLRQQKIDSLTFGEFWRDHYFPPRKEDVTERTWMREQSFYNKWLKQQFEDKPLNEINPLDLERIKRAMLKAGGSPRSAQYMIAVVRQVFNHAVRAGVFRGNNPTKAIKTKLPDNRRLRFLNREEAAMLLGALRARSQSTHDIAMLSLHTGMRAGEVFALEHGDVDLEARQLTLRNTKNGKTRIAYLTEETAQMLARYHSKADKPTDLVFPAQGGGVRKQVSALFSKVVNDLGLNNGIQDRRNKLTFHCLRHTYASWLVMAGTPLFTVGKLLGHSSSAMTERYSHLAPDHMRMTVQAIEQAITPGQGEKVFSIPDRQKD